MSKKGVNSRSKGNRGEYAVRDILSKWWGVPFRRTPSSGAYGTIHQQGSLVGDVVCDDPAFPFVVEVKNQESWSMEHFLTADKSKVWKWWAQAVDQAMASDKIPLLVFTRNRQPLFCAFPSMEMPVPLNCLVLTYSKQPVPYDAAVAIMLLSELVERTTKEDWLGK